MPSPEEMAQYDQLVPGASVRFLSQWERETTHRQSLERIQYESLAGEVRNVAKDRRLAMWLGFALGLAGLSAILYAALQGVDLAGLSALVISVGSLVWAVRRSAKGSGPPLPEAPNQEGQ